MEMVLILAMALPIYFLPLLIAWARDLPPLSLGLIAGGLFFLPAAGWFAGLYFSIADSPAGKTPR